MATYQERADLAADPVFIVRCREAIIKYLLYQLESNALSGAALSVAKDVLNFPDMWAQRLAIAASTEADVLTGDANDIAANTDGGDTALSYAVEVRLWPALTSQGPL